MDTPERRADACARDYLVACDGGRSTVREQLGLQLEGTQYEGRYVIVDIVQKTQPAGGAAGLVRPAVQSRAPRC